MTRFTVERLIGFPLAKAAKRQERVGVAAAADAALSDALEGCEERLRDDLLEAMLAGAAALLATRQSPLQAATKLRAVEGRLAPAIKAPDRRQVAEAVFGGRR